MGTIPRPKGFPIEGIKHMKELKNKFDLSFNEINHKIDIKVKVIINPLLQSMSGFRQAIFPAGEYVSDWVADVKKELNSLYVYCPLVEPRIAGDAQVPLLRIVPVEGRNGEMITRVFDPIQYCPLLQRQFQTVEIDIRDDTGSISAIRKRTSSGDTSLYKTKNILSRMKPTHRYDTKAYHDYYIQQAGKGYPVFVGRRYQRGLGSIFGGLFKAAMPLMKKGAKTLERQAFKTGLNIA
jgi:uncharacterized protein (UPF0248 family)